MTDSKQNLIARLTAERKREGKEPFTTSELLREFKHTRDSALIVIRQCLEYNGKGLKDAKEIYEYSRQQVKLLEREVRESEEESLENNYNGNEDEEY